MSLELNDKMVKCELLVKTQSSAMEHKFTFVQQKLLETRNCIKNFS